MLLDKDIENLLLIAGAFALGALVFGFFFKQEQSTAHLGIANSEKWKVVRDDEGFVQDIIISRDVHMK